MTYLAIVGPKRFIAMYVYAYLPTTFSERPERNPDDDLINSEKHQNKNQNYHQHSLVGVH